MLTAPHRDMVIMLTSIISIFTFAQVKTHDARMEALVVAPKVCEVLPVETP